MKPSLQVRLSQHLALTPQLQQSIRLLQLSTLELHQEVGQMLDQNPFLEAEEEAPPSPFDTPPERHARPTAPATATTATAPTPPTPAKRCPRSAPRNSARPSARTGRTAPSATTSTASARRRRRGAASDGGDGDDLDAQDRRAASGSLQDHLRAQIVGMRLSDDDRAALEVLLESLDGDGYLADPLEEIAERGWPTCWASTAARRRARSCTSACTAPCAGCRAWSPPAWARARWPNACSCSCAPCRPAPARELALRICEQHLELLARRDMKKLTALTGADEELVRAGAGADHRLRAQARAARSPPPRPTSSCPTSSCASPAAAWR